MGLAGSTCNAKYRILPPLPPERFAALKSDIAERGVQIPIIMDQDGNIIDGWHRRLACDELGFFCPSEVRSFPTEADKFRLIVEVNCNRRQMNRQEKRELIATYLVVDPSISDNWLADIIGGISKNTVADERRRLEETRQIPKLLKPSWQGRQKTSGQEQANNHQQPQGTGRAARFHSRRTGQLRWQDHRRDHGQQACQAGTKS